MESDSVSAHDVELTLQAEKYRWTMSKRQEVWLGMAGMFMITGLLLYFLQEPARAPILQNLGIFFMVASVCMLSVFYSEIRLWLLQPRRREAAKSAACIIALLAFIGGVFSLVFFHYTGDGMARDLGIALATCGAAVLCITRDRFMRGVNWFKEHAHTRLEVGAVLWLACMATIVGLTSADMPLNDLARGNYQAGIVCMEILLAFSTLVIFAGYREIFESIAECCSYD
jgi:hypothetical protein